MDAVRGAGKGVWLGALTVAWALSGCTVKPPQVPSTNWVVSISVADDRTTIGQVASERSDFLKIDDESLLTDPRVYPGEGDVAGLPPTIIVNSQWDDLRPSGERFAEQLEAAGVPVECSFEPDTFHGHLDVPEGEGFARMLATFLVWLRADVSR
mgnify:CR=1 FL=1